MNKNIAVFASGNGTNFQSLVDAERDGNLLGQVKLLVSDKPESFVNERAKINGIPVFSFEPKKYESKKDYESVIIDILREYKIDLIVLAGYMRIVGETLLLNYSDKIINLHPSLLPAFKGRNAIEQALNYGVKYTGVTMHFVDEGTDTGPIITQSIVKIDDSDTLESLTKKIQQIEHSILIESINLILTNRGWKKDKNIFS